MTGHGQAGIDRCWAQLSSVRDAGQCGWCKDRFGVSWQVTPQRLVDAMRAGDEAVLARVTRALLPMTKLDVAAIGVALRG